MGDRKGKIYRGSTRIRRSENPETLPFKMPITPIKVKESSEGKYLSKMLVAGTSRGLD
jgi:hypothetical protein